MKNEKRDRPQTLEIYGVHFAFLILHFSFLCVSVVAASYAAFGKISSHARQNCFISSGVPNETRR